MKIENRLLALVEANQDDSFINHRLYRMLYSQDLFAKAYDNIKGNKGALTKGVTRGTVDGTSLRKFERIIKKLKDESYKPKPCRRTYIPKANGKLRPLGIPTDEDRLVQECIKIILNCIYDSGKKTAFLPSSYGFREGLGCHAALKHVYENFQNCAWVIKADVKGFFDNVNHQILINLLRKRIKDERFINLIWKFLRAGYEEDGIFHATKSGTPQGGVFSPILANIYLHEFDKFVEELKISYGCDIIENPEYKRVSQALLRVRKKLDGLSIYDEFYYYYKDQVGKLEARRKTILSRIPEIPGKGVIKYVRYADDWVIAIKGNKDMAREVYEECFAFFRDHLKLQWNKEKSGFYRSNEKATDFLGVDLVYTKPNQVRLKKQDYNGKKRVRRSVSINGLRLLMDKRKVVKRLIDKGFLNDKGEGTHQSYLHYQSIGDIIKHYNSVMNGIYNYYCFVSNMDALRHIHFELHKSLGRTLAAKHKMSLKRALKRFGSPISYKVKDKIIRFTQPDMSYNPKRFQVKAVTKDWIPDVFVNTRSISWLKGETCGIPGCENNENIEMHHVRHVRKRGHQYKGIQKAMHFINRKQIPVCRECHMRIHRGEYDGISPKKLADGIAMKLGINMSRHWSKVDAPDENKQKR